jgi:hypothetical protein
MDKLPVPQPDRESYLKHRRDVIRQIILPIVLVTVIGVGFAALSVYAAAGGSAGVSLWADISLIWLIIPMMVLALVILSLLIALVYGMSKLLGVTPRYSGIAQEYALWLNAEIALWIDKIIQPVLTLRAWLELLTKREE